MHVQPCMQSQLQRSRLPAALPARSCCLPLLPLNPADGVMLYHGEQSLRGQALAPSPT